MDQVTHRTGDERLVPTEGESTETILAHSAFEKTMQDAQHKLRDGSAEWHSYTDVFVTDRLSS